MDGMIWVIGTTRVLSVEETAEHFVVKHMPSWALVPVVDNYGTSKLSDEQKDMWRKAVGTKIAHGRVWGSTQDEISRRLKRAD